MRPVELLRQLTDDVGARGVGQAAELLEVLVDVVPGQRPLERRPDEERALGRRGEGDDVAGQGSGSEEWEWPWEDG